MSGREELLLRQLAETCLAGKSRSLVEDAKTFAREFLQVSSELALLKEQHAAALANLTTTQEVSSRLLKADRRSRGLGWDLKVGDVVSTAFHTQLRPGSRRSVYVVERVDVLLLVPAEDERSDADETDGGPNRGSRPACYALPEDMVDVARVDD